MNRYAGKARIGVIAILGAAALAIAGLHRFSGRAYSADPTPTLFVTDYCSEAVTAYPAAGNGDVSPLAPAPTGLSEPSLMAIDASGNIYAANYCTNSVTIYASGSKGNSPPTAIIGGSNTGLNVPVAIALDSSGNIYVTNVNSPSVTVYPPLGSSTGLLNEAPTATISGSSTGLASPWGIALDSSANIYVADWTAASVYVYPALGSSTGLLNESPTATINGTDTGLINPLGITLDSSRNIYVADNGAVSVFAFPPVGSNTGLLNEFPTATITGNSTGLSYPDGITLDSSDNIYVADNGALSVFVYSPLGSSTGPLNESPIDTISGSTTGLASPVGIALDSSSKIYVADNGVNSVFVYPAGSNGNVAPSSATISTTTTTGLSYPYGIALNSSGNIYVVDDGVFGYGPGSVFVYAAGSNGNAVPIATISGSNTNLVEPVGIALDSSGKIYVADPGATSVNVYPAASNGNVIPSATITGNKTGLNYPYGIALDSGGKIYVADDGVSYCDGTQSVFVYPAKSTGDAAPVATISGSSTGLCFPSGIALDSTGKIYVTDNADVLVYPSLAVSGTGILNELPAATISGSSTGLSEPIGIALDSSDNIYVADYFTQSVFVYPAGSNGNIAPSATISGPNTELGAPLFIAFQSAATPPTATATPTVTPTAVSTPTTLSAAPATIKFGNVDATGTSKPKKMTLTNKGTNAAVIIQVIGSTLFHTAGEDTCSGQTIAPKKKCSFDIEFAPATPGVVSDQAIDVLFNGESPAMNLSGTGLAVTLKAPSKEKFSPVAAGGTGKSKKIKISNPATVSLSLGTTIVGGIDPTAFTIAGNGCTGTLAAKGNCTITMEFTPGSAATGEQSATVGFSYTYGVNAGAVSIPISGSVK